MTTYVIGYDLNKAGKNYDGLIEAIKAQANGWWHHLDSTWLIVSSRTAIEIRDSLLPYLDSDDELLVAVITGPAAWYGIRQSGSDWLKANL